MHLRCCAFTCIVAYSASLAKAGAPARNSATPEHALKCIWVESKLWPPMDVHWHMCTWPKEMDTRISRDVQSQGCYECGTVGEVITELREHQATLLDIGANIGAFSLPAAADGHAVFAFEPQPQNLARLTASIIANEFDGRLNLIAAGLAKDPSWANLPNYRKAKNQAGPVRQANASAGTVNASRARLPLLTLRSLPRIDGPVYIKMDIDGAECGALASTDAFMNSTDIVGVSMEWWIIARSTECCTSLLGSTLHIWRHVHGLVPYGRTEYGKFANRDFPVIQSKLCDAEYNKAHHTQNLIWRRQEPQGSGRGQSK